MPVQEEVDTGSALKDAENASRASKTHIFDMDFDDLDNVPLDRLLKKSSIPDVATAKCTYPILSVHSQESSSFEGVFVPTLGLHHASNVEPGPSHHSSVPDNVTTSNLHVKLAPALTNEPIVTEGRTDVHADETPANDEDNVELVGTGVHDDEIPVNENIEPYVRNDS